MNAVVVISDLHVGSTTGLCPKEGIALDEGGTYAPSKFQKTLWKLWQHFWGEFIPRKTDGAKKRILVINGDIIDGNHHNTTAIVSPSFEVQEAAAVSVLKPIAKEFDRVYVVRGTEAHVLPGAQCDERIATGIGAEVDEIGNCSTWQLWLETEEILFQFAHHIGVTSSAAYETSAPMREMVAGLIEAAQWGQKLPNVFVRSHRHRFVPVSIPSRTGRIQSVITPAWQLRTPHVERIDRMRMPHIGGVCFLVGDRECQTHEKLYPLPGPQVIRV